MDTTERPLSVHSIFCYAVPDSWYWTSFWFNIVEIFFNNNISDPSINQRLWADAALQKVMDGGFTLIDFERYVRIIVASRYMDSLGRTPFYISKKGISIMAIFGWGVRLERFLFHGGTNMSWHKISQYGHFKYHYFEIKFLKMITNESLSTVPMFKFENYFICYLLIYYYSFLNFLLVFCFFLLASPGRELRSIDVFRSWWRDWRRWDNCLLVRWRHRPSCEGDTRGSQPGPQDDQDTSTQRGCINVLTYSLNT